MAATCEHKPAIGCALTAVPECCACSDKRPFATAYPTYIDGKGMRSVGKRWQRYCWKCRDYWNLQSGTSSSSTRSNSDLIESPILPAPSPAVNMDGRQPNPFQVRDRQQQAWSFNALDEALPIQYFPVPHHRAAPDRPVRSSTARGQRSPQRPSARPGSDRYNWHNPLSRNQENVLPRNSQGNAVHPNMNGNPVHPATAPGPSQQPVYALGTREEVQSEDYVSPLATMYGRAWNRYREAEENRAANREALANTLANAAQMQADPMANMLDLLGSRPPQHPDPGQLLAESMEIRRRASQQESRERIDRLQQAQDRIQQVQEAVANPLLTPRANPIDMQHSRPPPLPSEEMVANIECRICHEQKMDTLLEPCMHLAICHWCLEVMRHRNRRYRVDPANGDEQLKCPICRRKVTQSRRIYVVL